VSLRCLIVDDNSWFIEAAAALLEREGLTVVGVATTAAEALAQMETVHPDVVLVDIFLGEESGLDLARRLAADGSNNKSTVIMISTHAEADVAGLVAGGPAAGFLPKAELSASAVRRVVATATGRRDT
jgi:two-component system, NarL family, nitrate/nitrite response regulator NarL